MPAHYDYLSFTLERGRAALSAFVAHVRDVAAPTIVAANAQVLGIFQGQLGFASNEASCCCARSRRCAIVCANSTLHPASSRCIPNS
jgi:hypothetical protein